MFYRSFQARAFCTQPANFYQVLSECLQNRLFVYLQIEIAQNRIKEIFSSGAMELFQKFLSFCSEGCDLGIRIG